MCNIENKAPVSAVQSAIDKYQIHPFSVEPKDTSQRNLKTIISAIETKIP